MRLGAVNVVLLIIYVNNERIVISYREVASE